MTFDLTDLRLVVNIVEQRSFTRGADLSFLSVPAASNRIKNLENRLGVELLYRSSGGVTITPVGRTFLQHARAMLLQAEHLYGDLQTFAKGIRGSIRMYAATTAITELLPESLSQFLSTRPDVNIILREHRSRRIVEAVSDGVADIGIVAEEIEGHSLQLYPYGKDGLTLIAPAHHDLAVQQAVDFAATLDYDFVGLAESSAMHSFMHDVSRMRDKPMRVRIEVSSIEAACQMVSLGVGLAIVPHSAAVRYAKSLNVRLIHLNDAWADRTLQICVRDLGALPLFARDLVNLLRGTRA